MTRSRGTRTHGDSSTAGGIWTDERSQSVVIGTILMFAIGIALLGLLQVTLIPSANGEVEAEHSQLVRGQMQDLNNDIRRSAATGADLSESIKLGVSYPPRAFFLNPAPAAGSISTEGTSEPAVRVQLENVEADNPETRDYWDGSARNFETGAVVYRSGYNVYSSAPEAVVVENSLSYSRFSSSTIVSTSQQVVDGRDISLVTLDGSLSRSQVGQTDVNLNAVSGDMETIAVSDSGSPITVDITTQLSEETLVADVFADEIDDDGATLTDADSDGTLECDDIASANSAPDRFIQECSFSSSPSGPFNTITLVMEPGATYNLQMSKVGIGNGATYDGEHYVTTGESPQGSMVDNAAREFTFEVRDRFNNPVSGVEVTLEAPDDSGDELTADGTTGNTITATTNEDGEINVVYDPNDVPDDSTETRRITAAVDTNGDGTVGGNALENAQFDVDIVDAEADSSVGSSINPAGPIILSDTRVAAKLPGSSGGGGNSGSLECTDDGNDCIVKFELEHTNPPSANTWEIKELRYHFYIAPGSPGSGTRDAPPREVNIYDDDGSDPCTSQTYTYQDNFQPTPFGSITPTGPDSTETFVLDFDESGTNFQSVQGDGMIITIIFAEQGNPDNEFSATYYVAPVKDTSYESDCAD